MCSLHVASGLLLPRLRAQPLDLGLHLIVTTPLPGCAALGKILNLSDSPCPHHVGNRDDSATPRPVGRCD